MYTMDGSPSQAPVKMEENGGIDPYDDMLEDEYGDDMGMSEISDSFDFDLVKERVALSLSERHDKDWLLSHGIMKDDVSAPLQATTQRIEFKIRQRNLTQQVFCFSYSCVCLKSKIFLFTLLQLSSRRSVDDLIGMHIMEQ